MDDEAEKPKVQLPIILLLPNLITVAAICAGLSALRFAFQGNFEIAVQLILVASVLDALDGRVARMLKSESALGAELDSLADFLDFGVAPGMMIYIWAFQDMHDVGWIAAVVYVLCCVMRLARFNVGNKSEMSADAKRFFVGVPAPAGAFLAMLPLFVTFMLKQGPVIPGGLIAIYVIGVGLLMISRIPTWSMKSVTISREHTKFFLIGFVAVIAALLSYPWATLVALDLAYFAGVFWSWRAARRAKRKNGV
jgi:CDP-diacylglycerol---serine O-phosphatidyltransferase